MYLYVDTYADFLYGNKNQKVELRGRSFFWGSFELCPDSCQNNNTFLHIRYKATYNLKSIGSSNGNNT